MIKRRQAVAALCSLASGISAAKTGKRVSWVIPFAPGGGTDTFARPLVTALTESGPDEHLLEYRPGAGGRIGAALAARAEPDGQTVFVGSVHHVVAQAINAAQDSLLTSFQPVVEIANTPDVLIVPSALAVSTVGQLVDFANANAKKVGFASSGIGTSRHVLGECFNKLFGTHAAHIPYSGSGPALRALLASEVHFMFEGIGPALPQIRAGKLRALAVSGSGVPSLLDVPSFEEAGIGALAAGSWYGAFLPHRSAMSLVRELNSQVVEALQTSAMREIWLRNEAVVVAHSPIAFREQIQKELIRWSQLAQMSSIAGR